MILTHHTDYTLTMIVWKNLDAEKAFNNAVKENPNSIIDVLSNDGEQSFFGYNN